MARNKDRKIFSKAVYEGCEGPTEWHSGSHATPTITQDLLDAGIPVNKATDGIINTPAPSPFITFNAAQNETVFADGGSYIVFGNDRPSQAPMPGARGVDSPSKHHQKLNKGKKQAQAARGRDSAGVLESCAYTFKSG